MSPAKLPLNAQGGASESADKVTLVSTDMVIGREAGKNLRPGYEENESQNLGHAGIEPPGTGKEAVQSLQASLGINSDDLMDLKQIEERLAQQTCKRLKPGTFNSYRTAFRRLFKEEGLDKYSRRQLAGPKGKQLILHHLNNHITKPAVSMTNAALCYVWEKGVGLPYPINLKDDFGKLPKTERRFTPPDATVKEWAEAMSREKDSYLRLIWLFIADFGWRPSHCRNMRWSDVLYDQEGHPYAIHASGKDHRFKTYASVLVSLPPDVAKALEEWRHIHPNPDSNGWLICQRSVTASRQLTPTQQLSNCQFKKFWNILREKYGLPKLNASSLRHWVSTQARKVGLDDNARAWMQGHDATTFNSSMGVYYDNEGLEEVLKAQRMAFPNGALAAVLGLKVELEADRDPEALAIFDKYLAGKMGTMEFASLMESVRMKVPSKPDNNTLMV